MSGRFAQRPLKCVAAITLESATAGAAYSPVGDRTAHTWGAFRISRNRVDHGAERRLTYYCVRPESCDRLPEGTGDSRADTSRLTGVIPWRHQTQIHRMAQD